MTRIDGFFGVMAPVVTPRARIRRLFHLRKGHSCWPNAAPRDIDEPRLLPLADETARFLDDRKSQAGYDEYLHIGCYAFFGSCANAAIGEALDTLSTGPPLSMKNAAAAALIRAGHRTHAATEEAARTRLGFLHLSKGGQTSSDSDRVFAELAHERFCRPRPTAVSSPLDEIRQAFVNRTLEVSLHAAIKEADGATFAKATQTCHPDTTPRPRRRLPTNARPQQRQRHQ
jgi:hypothetical protein